MQWLYRENGKENGSYYLGVQGFLGTIRSGNLPNQWYLDKMCLGPNVFLCKYFMLNYTLISYIGPDDLFFGCFGPKFWHVSMFGPQFYTVWVKGKLYPG